MITDRKDAVPVTTVKRRLVRIGNKIGVWMYRAFDGRLASYNKGAKILMITTPGRRTGVLHSTCVRYLDAPEGLLVWGTASGFCFECDGVRKDLNSYPTQRSADAHTPAV